MILATWLSWYFADLLFRRTPIFAEQLKQYWILLYYKFFFFSYFFSCFFKYVQKISPMHEMSPVYVQKNSPMHETSPIVVVIDVLKQKIFDFKLKETRNSYFRVTPQNYRLMFFSWKMLKSTVTKKVIVCFYNFRWRKFLKVAAYVIFPTSIMPLFEICQTLKGHFLNELRVSFNDYNND